MYTVVLCGGPLSGTTYVCVRHVRAVLKLQYCQEFLYPFFCALCWCTLVTEVSVLGHHPVLSPGTTDGICTGHRPTIIYCTEIREKLEAEAN